MLKKMEDLMKGVEAKKNTELVKILSRYMMEIHNDFAVDIE